MSVKIIIDSTSDTTAAIRERLTVVPLTILFGQEEYVDGVTINHRMFYEKLIESDVLPTTSQATPEAFMRAFEKVADDGDEAVVITVSSRLSGTYQSAMIAAQDFENIHIVDSGSVAIGGGILAELALRYMDEGNSAAEIAEKLREDSRKICVLAMLDTLEYLKRGGRISRTAAIAGGLLNIKPVISVADGEIIVQGKARGSKQANNLLVREIEKSGGVDFSKPCLLGYTGLSDELIRKYMADSAALWQDSVSELCITPVGSVVGTHAGPGAIAVAFFKK